MLLTCVIPCLCWFTSGHEIAQSAGFIFNVFIIIIIIIIIISIISVIIVLYYT